MMKHSGFVAIRTGYLVSLLGSALTTFAISVTLFQLTKSSLVLSTVLFCKFLPSIYFSMIAGSVVDKFEQKKILLCTSFFLAVCSCFLYLLITAKYINLNLVYFVLIIAGTIESFQNLSFQLVTASYVNKDYALKYNGILAVVESLPAVIGPLLGAAMLAILNISSLILLDIASYGVLLIFIFALPFPASKSSASTKLFSFDNLFSGFRYILSHVGLKKIQLIFSALNFFNGLTAGLITAYILLRTGANKNILASVTSVAAIGSVVGALSLAAMPMKIKKINLMLYSLVFGALIGRIIFALSDSVSMWSVALFARNFLVQTINVANTSIWQRCVSPEIQGRVFGARRVLGQGAYPFAILLGGWLGQSVFTDNHFYWMSDISANHLLKEGIGITVLLVISGCFEIMFALFGFLSKDLMKFEENILLSSESKG